MSARLPIPARAWDKLQPFINHKHARQRVILYLVAAGFTVPDLRKMTAGELRACALHPQISVARDEALEGLRDSDVAFARNGRTLPHTAFYRFIRLAAETALGRPMSHEQLRAYVNELKK